MGGKRVAIVGAGPIGLEAALHGVRRGHDVTVHESGTVGAAMRRWGFVRLFSPAGLNRSALALEVLRAAGQVPPPDGAFLTGHEHVRAHLAPLAGSALLAGRVREHHRVAGIAREDLGKGAGLGGGRAGKPFRLLVDTPHGERAFVADVVIDASGTYDNPNWLGSGGLPALGERGLRGEIDYRLVDLRGDERERFAGRRVLVVGHGLSAATALDALVDLPATEIVWASRTTAAAPLHVVLDDPLPERARLVARANELAHGRHPRVVFRGASSIERVSRAGAGFEVELRSSGGSQVERVDRILAHVGFSPDRSLWTELQVHECYASFGTMKLAAALLGSGSADCLAQASPGPETLENPEPDFYVIGAKSYGRNPHFLIRTGLEQVRDVYRLVERRGDVELDPGAPASSRAAGAVPPPAV